MLMVVKKYIILIYKYFIFNLKCNISYKTNFIFQILSIIIDNLFLLFFWFILYSNISNIGGYSFKDTLLLIGLINSIKGFSLVFFGNCTNISDIIIKGTLDKFILQPKELLINICSSKTDISGWGMLIYGYISLFIALNFQLNNLILFTFFTLTGSIIFLSSFIIINSLTFFLKNVENTKRFLEIFITEFSTFPQGIYNNIFNIIFYTVIPIGFMVYIPVNVLNNSITIFNCLLVLLMSILYLFIAYIIFYKGLKKYESGNLIQNIL